MPLIGLPPVRNMHAYRVRHPCLSLKLPRPDSPNRGGVSVHLDTAQQLSTAQRTLFPQCHGRANPHMERV